jgi:hypothetical protein
MYGHQYISKYLLSCILSTSVDTEGSINGGHEIMTAVIYPPICCQLHEFIARIAVPSRRLNCQVYQGVILAFAKD